MADRFLDAKQLFKLGKYRQALSEFLKVSDEPLENPDLSYYMGLCYSKIEEWDDALLYLEQVVNSHDDILRIYQSRMILSYIYTITGRIKLAEFELNKLIEEGFESPQVYSNYSYIYYESGKVEKSIEYLYLALDLDPENPNALNSIGYILADRGIDVDMAVTYCQKAVKAKPENPAYLDSLGWAFFKSGQNDEARHYLKRAFDIATGNKTIAAHLRAVIDEIERINKARLG
ncbi:MAG: tetratricopeptide repeat protein [Spirochaetales bacterium]|uniref:Tetratricopeptide repeat protein n=1 Tax=Candidatus Thalassospirochaeta sargassi TaxID=3119039 RepID=A0AAJ1IC03_9SPIO|nr:tetratricopeptide repeat protein [Spirochaetales bacterium]